MTGKQRRSSRKRNAHRIGKHHPGAQPPGFYVKMNEETLENEFHRNRAMVKKQTGIHKQNNAMSTAQKEKQNRRQQIIQRQQKLATHYVERAAEAAKKGS